MKVVIRKIRTEDNPAIQRIIQTVMPELGAGGLGFAINDGEVLNMYEAYQHPRSVYYVCEVNGMIVGGGGIAPLEGGDQLTCELKKMYFLNESRGKGFGQQMLSTCLRAARDFGYEKCYLETFNTMTTAMRLYEKNGFVSIPRSLGNTGHFACDRFYILDLKEK
jgi:putative acetyltransferase